MMALLIIFNIYAHVYAHAQVPGVISAESIQLQKLISKTEDQIKALNEILAYAQRDSASLDRAGRILEQMTTGIDKSIEEYHGTAAYEKALLELQASNDFERTYVDSEEIKGKLKAGHRSDPSEELNQKIFEGLKKFQKESVRANQTDLLMQAKLQDALGKAEPGFVPKIEAQAQLGSWQANTRLSAQLTELLAAVHAMREELRSLRRTESGANALGTLIEGSEMQNRLQRKEVQP